MYQVLQKAFFIYVVLLNPHNDLFNLHILQMKQNLQEVEKIVKSHTIIKQYVSKQVSY